MEQNQKGFSLIEALIVIVVIATFAGLGWYIWRQSHKTNGSSSSAQQANILTASDYENRQLSNFTIGGENNDSTRTYDRFSSSGGYNPLKLDVAKCIQGQDSVGFGLGHTVFAIEGIKGKNCEFWYGTEVESPNWNGELGVKCEVPTSTTVQLKLSDDGINFSPIAQYCKSQF